jgi:transcriptional regulator with XRE-family HTH domain
VITPPSPDRPVQDESGGTSQGAPPPGVVAGAVLRSARMSAGLSEAQLAASAGVSETAIHSWEDGSQPLADVAAPQMERLETALRAAGAEPRLVTDLAVAAWCDLVILAIASAEDPSCLLADPLAAEETFRELLAWSIADQPPARHQPYASPGRLLPTADIRLVAGIVNALNTLPQPGRRAA